MLGVGLGIDYATLALWGVSESGVLVSCPELELCERVLWCHAIHPLTMGIMTDWAPEPSIPSTYLAIRAGLYSVLVGANDDDHGMEQRDDDYYYCCCCCWADVQCCLLLPWWNGCEYDTLIIMPLVSLLIHFQAISHAISGRHCTDTHRWCLSHFVIMIVTMSYRLMLYSREEDSMKQSFD